MGKHPLSWPALAVWSVWTVMTAGLGAMICTYGSDFPLRDDFGSIYYTTGTDPFTWKTFWGTWGGHHVGLTRLLLIVLARLSDSDFRAPMYSSLALISSVSGLLIWEAFRLRGRASYADLFIPLVLLHPGHAESFLLGWDVQNTLAGFLLCVLLVAILEHKGGMVTTTIIGLCLTALPLTGSVGMPIALALLPWYVLPLLRMRRKLKPVAVPIIVLGIAAAYVLTRCLLDLPGRLFNPGVLEIGVSALDFMAMGFGPAARSAILAADLLAGAACVIATASLVRSRSVGLLALLIGLGGVALGVGLSRSGESEGWHPCAEDRYAILAAPVLCLAYFVAIQSKSSKLQFALAALLAIALWPNASAGLAHAREQLAGVIGIENELRDGVSVADVTERHELFLLSPFRGRTNPRWWIENGLILCQREKLGPFREGSR